ncbi:MAG: hypothetical protein KJS97_02025 [Alphaproteobacteria bacterium]|nr:hypothetical protein [Alphaproteobacteria bacterium]
MSVRAAVELSKSSDDGGTVTVSVEHLEDGAVQVFHYDIGSRALALHGDSDYEAWATVAPENVAKLAFALLAEKFAGRSDALTAMQKFCADHDIPVTVGMFA